MVSRILSSSADVPATKMAPRKEARMTGKKGPVELMEPQSVDFIRGLLDNKEVRVGLASVIVPADQPSLLAVAFELMLNRPP